MQINLSEETIKTVCNYSDLETINQEDKKKRQEIIDTISLLSPSESIVLYKCYVDNMRLDEIAEDVCHSYSWVSKRHSEGIKNIQKILDDREKAGD